MSAVLDTNVVVSGLLSPAGPAGQLLDRVIEEAVVPCVDGRILEEYETVLRRPELGIPREHVDAILATVYGSGERVVSTPLPVDLPHPADRPFLEVAAAAGVPLVTGNQRHFPKSTRMGVAVLGPREFLDLLGREGPGRRSRR